MCVSFVSISFIRIYNINENMEAQNRWYLPSVNASVQVMWSFVCKNLILSRSSRGLSQLRRCCRTEQQREQEPVRGCTPKPSSHLAQPFSRSHRGIFWFAGVGQGPASPQLLFQQGLRRPCLPLPEESALLSPREWPVKLFTLKPDLKALT